MRRFANLFGRLRNAAGPPVRDIKDNPEAKALAGEGDETPLEGDAMTDDCEDRGQRTAAIRLLLEATDKTFAPGLFRHRMLEVEDGREAERLLFVSEEFGWELSGLEIDDDAWFIVLKRPADMHSATSQRAEHRAILVEDDDLDEVRRRLARQAERGFTLADLHGGQDGWSLILKRAAEPVLDVQHKVKRFADYDEMLDGLLEEQKLGWEVVGCDFDTAGFDVVFARPQDASEVPGAHAPAASSSK